MRHPLPPPGSMRHPLPPPPGSMRHPLPPPPGSMRHPLPPPGSMRHPLPPPGSMRHTNLNESDMKTNSVKIRLSDPLQKRYGVETVTIVISHDNKHTKPCNNVYIQNGFFTKCTNDGCNYAHTLSQFKIKKCSHDMRCHKMKNKHSKFTCPYIHSNEDGYDWTHRTGTRLPLLPLDFDSDTESMSCETKNKTSPYDEHKSFEEFLNCSNYLSDIKNNSIDILTYETYAEKALEFALKKGISNISIKIIDTPPPMIINLSESDDESDYN